MKIPSTNPRTVKYNVNKTFFIYLSDILIYFLMKCFNPWMVSRYSSRHLSIINRKHYKEIKGKILVRGLEEKPFCTCCPWEALKGKLGRGVH